MFQERAAVIVPLYVATGRKGVRAFEALVGVRVAEVVRCPGCDGTELDRHFGLPARGRVVESSAAEALL